MSEISTAAGLASWRSFRTAAWLGWQIESNWARPWLFALYAVVKPLALAGILVVMYATINRGNFAAPAFTFMYVGHSFYMYVGAVMSGMGWSVVQDREHYQTLRSIFTAPMDVRVYLVGRGVARFALASFSVLLSISAGVAFLGVPIGLATIDWPLLTLALALGLVMLAFMGLTMAGIMLMAGQEAWSIGELLAGALYLFSGAIFPIDVLPAVLRPLGLLMPVTYWLELVRRALGVSRVGEGTHGFAALSLWSDGRLLTVLLVVTMLLAAVAGVSFRLCERSARERGLLDRTSNY